MSFKYPVLDTLDHDGNRYEEGDLIELEDGQAANLARIGVVSPYPAEMAVSGGSSPRVTSGGSRKAKDKPAPENGDASVATPGSGSEEADGAPDTDGGAKE